MTTIHERQRKLRTVGKHVLTRVGHSIPRVWRSLRQGRRVHRENNLLPTKSRERRKRKEREERGKRCKPHEAGKQEDEWKGSCNEDRKEGVQKCKEDKKGMKDEREG